jgi:hypothetical protein
MLGISTSSVGTVLAIALLTVLGCVGEAALEGRTVDGVTLVVENLTIPQVDYEPYLYPGAFRAVCVGAAYSVTGIRRS